MILHAESHVDHIPAPVLAYVLERFADRMEPFFIETIELPEGMTVECGLYGPAMGDGVIPETEVEYAPRGDRKYPSRLVDRPMRRERTLTVVAGKYQGHPCVLYTAYGGPVAPKDPGDPTLRETERPGSEVFWKHHALARPRRASAAGPRASS